MRPEYERFLRIPSKTHEQHSKHMISRLAPTMNDIWPLNMFHVSTLLLHTASNKQQVRAN